MKTQDNRGNELIEKFHRESIDSLSDIETLELLLYYASYKKKDTKELADKLIKRFTTLYNVFSASYQDLRLIDGITPHTATLISMIMDIKRLHCGTKAKPASQNFDFEKTGSYVTSKFIGLKYEMILIIAYNSKLKYVAENFVKGNSKNSISLNYENLFGFIANKNISYIVMAHNHPSVSTDPSVEDKIATQNIKDFLNAMNIELLEHYIVFRDTYRGIINHPEENFRMDLLL